MSNNYEFTSQTRKQKLTIIGLKAFVASMIGLAVWDLGWPLPNYELQDKLGAVGSIFIGFWLYANLCNVKVEVQEIFVPPFKIMTAIEFMFIGSVFLMTNMGMIIYDIWRMS